MSLNPQAHVCGWMGGKRGMKEELQSTDDAVVHDNERPLPTCSISMIVAISDVFADL